MWFTYMQKDRFLYAIMQTHHAHHAFSKHVHVWATEFSPASSFNSAGTLTSVSSPHFLLAFFADWQHSLQCKLQLFAYGWLMRGFWHAGEYPQAYTKVHKCAHTLLVTQQLEQESSIYFFSYFTQSVQFLIIETMLWYLNHKCIQRTSTHTIQAPVDRRPLSFSFCLCRNFEYNQIKKVPDDMLQGLTALKNMWVTAL